MFFQACKLSLATTILMLAGMAYGDIISYQQTIADTYADGTGINITIPLQKFDTTLGTLTGVELKQVTNIKPELWVMNFSTVAQSFTNGSINAKVVFTGPDSTPNTASATYSGVSGIANPPQYSISIFPGSTQQVTQTADVPAGNFSLYEGVGTSTANFTVASNCVDVSITGGPVGVSGSETAGGVFSVAYTFTPAPEPSTIIGFLSLGAMALVIGLCRRFK
jgi:hypothetical protein